MNVIRISIFLFLFASQPVFCEKNDTISNVLYGFQAHYGFIIPHSKAIRDISHTNPAGLEIIRSKLHTSPEKFKAFNAYWISGLEARYFNYQNPEILGGVFDFSLFAEPVVSYGRNYLFTVRGGAGFSYHTKVYDAVQNPQNLFFSSRISFPVFVDLRYKYKLGEKTFLTFSGCYNHISNGGIMQPNKGMNFPTFALGFERYNNSIPVLHNEFKLPFRESKPDPFVLIQALSSVKVVGGVNDVPEKTSFIYGLHARYTKPLGSYYALNAGGELILDGFIKETINRAQENKDHKRFALTVGQDFMLGNIVFTQYFGFYLYSPYKPPDPVYQKYELAYRLNRKLMLGVYLKAHLHVAELMGINVNLSLPGKLTK